MELKQIEAFLKIVEKGSFSAAAEELYISQPTISVRIRQLETELKKPLFERLDGRKVILSSYGEMILPYFQEALDLLKEGRVRINENLKNGDKMVISCPNHMGAEILPELLKELYQHYPQIEFDVKINMTEQIIEDIRIGKVDIGLGYLMGEEETQDLNAMQIINEKTILVCGPVHPMAAKRKVSFQDIIQERVIIYDRDFLTTRKIEGYLQKNGVTDYRKIEVNNLGWIKMMVRKGLGIAFLQKNIVGEELKNRKLTEISISKAPPSTPIYLLFGPKLESDMKEIAIKTTRSLFYS